MMEILTYISSGLIILAFIGYVVLVLINRGKTITKSDGFNITKDILQEYDSINIVENKGYFTVYNIKRRVIHLASKCYYGNSLSDIAISLMEAGISGIDNYKNKVINFFRNIIPNLKILYIIPMIAIGINSMTYNISDAKVSIIIMVIFSIISYMLIGIKTEAIMWIDKGLKKNKDIIKDDHVKIINFMNQILFFDKLIFFGELLMIIRFVAIMLEIL